MSRQSERHRGRLFENKDKRKPSQPDMQGDGYIGGKPYAITAWKRHDQLVLSIAPPRDKAKNTYPPEEFRGALDTAKGDVLWAGNIEGEEAAYSVQVFEKQGKSGPYLSLELSPTERTPAVEYEAPEADAPSEAPEVRDTAETVIDAFE